jgi:hypothetical protein
MMAITSAPSDFRALSGARVDIHASVERLERGRIAEQQRPLPGIAQRLLVDALHERAVQGGLTDRAISDAWQTIRHSLRLDPRRKQSTPLGLQSFGFLAARYLGTGGPVTAERLRAIDRQNHEPMRLASAPHLSWGVGESKHIIDIARDALGASRALDFLTLWESWTGCSVGDAANPDTSTRTQQRTFTRIAWSDKLDTSDMMRVLRGEVLVMESPRTKQLDFVAREHNTLDVLLAAWSLGRSMPDKILHFDRHSDYVNPDVDEPTLGPRHLAGLPQAAVWWSLLDVIKRSDGETPLADPYQDVAFVTHLSPKEQTRKLTGARTSPLNPRDTKWANVAQRIQSAPADFVSYDLDLIMPSDQMRASQKMLRDPRFQEAMLGATTRLFVVSPQFSGGGDEVGGGHATHSPATYTRVLNVVRRAGGAIADRASS